MPTKLVYVPRTRIKRFLRKLSVWPFLFTVGFGLMPAMALGGHWLVIAISIMLLSFAAYIAVIVLTIKDITVKKRLIMQTLVFSVMILSISWVLILYFILIYGFTVFLFLIYVPPLLVPPLAGMKYAKAVRSDAPYDSSGNRDTTLSYIGYVSGTVGTGVGGVMLLRTGWSTILIYILFICAVLSSILLPFGLLSIQRLYYLSKLEKMGITLEDPVPPRYEID